MTKNPEPTRKSHPISRPGRETRNEKRGRGYLFLWIYRGFTTLAVIAFVTWRLEPQLGLLRALAIGLVLGVMLVLFFLSSNIYSWFKNRKE